ncbi:PLASMODESMATA CALLOSE-BINDING PROTEIN 4 [Beta vulgaris subsp. vulgaris]|uniref:PLASMODESMATA CALLOSE-BINDING PROTEIN 4 n=1 Tax=Beta vulgaris subsp. vulgaris TaxID=3555 RepID=UPI0020367DE4|nr:PLASMODESMATA CALLOSE-BINDING PROTEIN 4 [Beta vulgaris subsp. vulgaris]
MTTLNSLYIIILLLSSLCISIFGEVEAKRVKTQSFHSSSNGKRKLQNLIRKLDDETMNQPSTTLPTTNPANFPPYTPTPTIVTIPASNPTTPVDPFPTTPPTTTVPASTTPTPIFNPANPANVPVTNQPTTTPTTAGQTWCVANTGASETSLQAALDYACGIGGADCSTIQDGGSCYNPNSLQNHASYAFNSYFQKNPQPTSCDFGGSAVLVNTNPSSGSCIYPSSGSGTGTAMPSSTNPPITETPSSIIPPPTTTSSSGTTGSPYGGPATTGIYGTPPSLSNPSNPNSLFPASYGPDSPPLGNSVPAGSAVLQPHISLIILVASFTGKLILGTYF